MSSDVGRRMLQEAPRAQQAQQAGEAQQAHCATQAKEAQHAQQAQQAREAQHAQQAKHALEPQHSQQAQEVEYTEQLQAVDSLVRGDKEPREVASEPHKQSWLSALKPSNIVRKRKSSAEGATVKQAVVGVSRADGAAANVGDKTHQNSSKGKRMHKLTSMLKRGVGKATPGCMRAPVVFTHSQASADVQPLPAIANSSALSQPPPLQPPQQQPQQQQKKQGLKSKVFGSSMFAAFDCTFLKGNKPVEPSAALDNFNTLRDQPGTSTDSDASKASSSPESEQAVSGPAGNLDTPPAQHGGASDLIRAVRVPSGLADLQQADMQQEGDSATADVSLQQVSFSF